MFYIHEQEIWDAKKCDQMAKRTQKDGMGTPYPFKGYIPGSSSSSSYYGEIRYNGGIVINEIHYEGEIRLLPQVAPGYEIVKVPTWGSQIKKIVH